MTAAALKYARIFLSFHGDTKYLLRPPQEHDPVVYPLTRRASIKDIIEGLGVPHTEVGRILLDGQDQSFEKIPHDGEYYRIEPLSADQPPTVSTFLRPKPLPACIFLVDINVGRLTGLLRMAGFDAEAVAPGAAAEDSLRRAAREGRILLTRNQDLLRHRRLVFGRLVRSQNPEEQLTEIIHLYRLQGNLAPFTRCIVCNGMLTEVDKAAIIQRLQPLTKRYFNRFKQCSGCGKIYWQGSHHEKMVKKLHRIVRQESDQTPPRT